MNTQEIPAVATGNLLSSVRGRPEERQDKREGRMMEIQMYNVGLGECFLLGQGDERIAVNCGTRNKKINGRDSAGIFREIGGDIRRNGCTVFLTQFDPEHVGGFLQIVREESAGIQAVCLPDLFSERWMSELLALLLLQDLSRSCFLPGKAVTLSGLMEVLLTLSCPIRLLKRGDQVGDIQEMLAGSADAMGVLRQPGQDNPAWQYAAARNALYAEGKLIELLACYEPHLRAFGEWWKQLFGESEGKDGQGVFPASVEFTTDLHSMGQYIQEGARNLFETVVRFTVPQSSCLLDPVPGDHSGLDFLRGKDLRFVNEQARRGTVLAHVAGGVPNLLLTVQERTPYWAGQLVYFFEYACGLSGYLLGVNPFNQPGVEAYKTNMFALLGKPGFAARREDLLSKGPS